MLIFGCHGNDFLHCKSLRAIDSERGTVMKIPVASANMIRIEKLKLFWKSKMLGYKELLTYFGKSMPLVYFCMDTQFQGRPEIALFSQGFAQLVMISK